MAGSAGRGQIFFQKFNCNFFIHLVCRVVLDAGRQGVGRSGNLATEEAEGGGWLVNDRPVWSTVEAFDSIQSEVPPGGLGVFYFFF
jgi:hypothetical protein